VATSPELTHWPGSLQNSVVKFYQEMVPLGKRYMTFFNRCIPLGFADLQWPLCEYAVQKPIPL